MTKADVDRLFTLLRELYPRITPKLGPNTKIAWLAVLEPFDYEPVKAKLLEWNRGPEGRSFPDPRECIPEMLVTEQQQQPQTDGDPVKSLNYFLYLFGALRSRGPGWDGIYTSEELERTLKRFEAAHPENSRLQDLVKHGYTVLAAARADEERENARC